MSDAPLHEADDTNSGMSRASASKRRWWLLGAAVVVVALIAGFLVTRPASGPTTTTQTIEVAAEMTTIETTVATSGTINPAQRADLSFTTAGTVTAVKVSVGDPVEAGQALAAIDLKDLRSAVSAAKSAVNAAQKDYNDAKKSGGSTKIAAAKSTLRQKQNELDTARTALADGTLKAPFAGTVAIVNVSVGDKVTAASSNYPGGITGASSEAAVTVISANTYQVATSIGSADIGAVTKGQRCVVTPNGTTTALPGTVASVGVIATESDASGASFPVMIDITGAQTGVYAGVTASVSIVTATREALTVPTMAITYVDGVAQVEVKGASAIKVQTGVTTGGRTEITAGLKVGDVVVVTVTVTERGGPSGFQTMMGGGRQRPSDGGQGPVVIGPVEGGEGGPVVYGPGPGGQPTS